MNLVIDIGNTAAKAALYDGTAMLQKERFTGDGTAHINSFLGDRSVKGAIVSSVSTDPAPLLRFLSGRVTVVHYLTWQSRYPFRISYKTPDTLGVDRLAAAAGAMLHHPGANLLVIDAGSALTIDVMADETYLGGSISPGLSMRFRALHEYTGRLPLAEPGRKFTFPGKSTRDAITGGVIMGLAFEINEYIRTFEERHKNLTVVITGGDGELISSFADREMAFYPDLVTDGLNYLLDYNV
ncbi:MAG: type III pantothenate kinase [Bacteroidales bacterium]|jgi:type III pantothenate kinase|nr:type III pantothenate kinase [Bacteroidales bacterium]